ncbi:hypothetical protein HanHA300_Chr03g0088531 [Helianthus annuus]|nr:hypothetical protein HanHA300_Chr03g0088531 [Helianthus annuus]KAJ0600368.1 hypothetical protein HanIR_Chr03g0115841 [Helianthus annuus]KAJ0607724.1 hypothetical protein HanHA89_Chr03g0100111 [Helianthus annuus]KAJ0767789.1 hypothetical protein HanLR1_Chr03g0093491 [Helianthus annuus]
MGHSPIDDIKSYIINVLVQPIGSSRVWFPFWIVTDPTRKYMKIWNGHTILHYNNPQKCPKTLRNRKTKPT